MIQKNTDVTKYTTFYKTPCFTYTLYTGLGCQHKSQMYTHTHTHTLSTVEVFNPELTHVGTLMRHNRNNHKSNVTSWWLQRGAFSKSLSISAVIVQWKQGKDCDFYNGDTCKISLVPDAESFGLLDVEEGRFNLWFVAFTVWGGEPTTVDVWVLLLKLKQNTRNVWLSDSLFTSKSMRLHSVLLVLCVRGNKYVQHWLKWNLEELQPERSLSLKLKGRSPLYHWLLHYFNKRQITSISFLNRTYCEILDIFWLNIKGLVCYLFQFLASVLLAYILVRQQHLQQLLHRLLGSFQLLLFKLCTANLMAERVDGHWNTDRIAAINIRNTVKGNLGSGEGEEHVHLHWFTVNSKQLKLKSHFGHSFCFHEAIRTFTSLTF